MASAVTLPAADLEQAFSVDQLYELQKRRGKAAEPKFSYAQRNNLKAKFRHEHEFGGAVRHGMFVFYQDVCSVFSAFFSSPVDGASWLNYWLWGHHFRGTDIRSGRSRFATRRPSAPRELSEPIYDPHQAGRQ